MFGRKKISENGKLITSSAILRRCIVLEQRGLEFYRALARGAKSDWIRKLALMMTAWEKRHKRRFQYYLKKAEREIALKGLPPTHAVPSDVKRLLEVDVFANAPSAQKMGQNIGERQALVAAIDFERSLAILYTELRPYVIQSQRKFIERLIKEEIGHQNKLESYYKKYFNK